MTKNEIVSEIEIQTGRDKEVIKQIVDAVFSNIKVALAKGDKVSILQFGTFSVHDVADRKGRNPRTGETIIIPAHKKVQFSSSPILRDSVN